MKRIISFIIILSFTACHVNAAVVYAEHPLNSPYYSYFTDSQLNQTAQISSVVDDAGASSTVVKLYSDLDCTEWLEPNDRYDYYNPFAYSPSLGTMTTFGYYMLETEVNCLSLDVYDSTETLIATYTVNDNAPYIIFSSTTITTNVSTTTYVDSTTDLAQTYTKYSELIIISFALGFAITTWILHLYLA